MSDNEILNQFIKFKLLNRQKLQARDNLYVLKKNISKKVSQMEEIISKFRSILQRHQVNFKKTKQKQQTLILNNSYLVQCIGNQLLMISERQSNDFKRQLSQQTTQCQVQKINQQLDQYVKSYELDLQNIRRKIQNEKLRKQNIKIQIEEKRSIIKVLKNKNDIIHKNESKIKIMVGNFDSLIQINRQLRKIQLEKLNSQKQRLTITKKIQEQQQRKFESKINKIIANIDESVQKGQPISKYKVAQNNLNQDYSQILQAQSLLQKRIKVKRIEYPKKTLQNISKLNLVAEQMTDKIKKLCVQEQKSNSQIQELKERIKQLCKKISNFTDK